MRRVIAVAAMSLALMVPLTGSAFADQGGVPNDNATNQTGNGTPQGRKGSCVPPGSVFSDSAKLPGPNTLLGEHPGQAVKEFCTPGGG
jgi:hypothetical protein